MPLCIIFAKAKNNAKRLEVAIFRKAKNCNFPICSYAAFVQPKSLPLSRSEVATLILRVALNFLLLFSYEKYGLRPL